jgi:hypothetical protein
MIIRGISESGRRNMMTKEDINNKIQLKVEKLFYSPEPFTDWDILKLTLLFIVWIPFAYQNYYREKYDD